MSQDCAVCLEVTDNKCPLCENYYCRECTDNYDRAILETEDSSKYPKCINPKCEFLHTYSVIRSDLKGGLLKRTLAIESSGFDEIRIKVEKEKQMEVAAEKIEQQKQDLLDKLPKSLSILGKTFIKTNSRKADAKEMISKSKVVFIKMCPMDYCDGMITDKFVCTKCDLKLCSECEEHETKGHVCDPQIVRDVKFILSESRPCPKCKIRITKSEGCDHMWCPNCKTHFSYNTGKISYNGFIQPEQVSYYQNKYKYTLKPKRELSDSEKSFIVKGDLMFRKTPDNLPKLKYNLIRGDISSETYEKKICTLFEKDYIKNLTRELYLKVKKSIYEDSSEMSVEKFLELQRHVMTPN